MTISVRNFGRDLFPLRFLFYDQFAISPSSLICLAFYWALTKCTFKVVSGEVMAK
jgi:hypothetical protein